MHTASYLYLTNNPNDKEPAWCPDGSKIAFSPGNQIYVMDADGANQTRLTNSGTDGGPTWSPDGRKIVFYRHNRSNLDIYVMNDDGSSQTNITNNSVNDYVPD